MKRPEDRLDQMIFFKKNSKKEQQRMEFTDQRRKSGKGLLDPKAAVLANAGCTKRPEERLN